ncbi:hypothetical protein ACGFY9_13945 [Streptomyces sp. NPDC048504]|uniref:hypothetical protein n=1 Tax=Streptomyces sp. NPDC048504 TaxID=3365559 RepID=UPI00370FFE8D
MTTGNEPPVPAEPDPTPPGPTNDGEHPNWERPRNGMGRFQRTLKSVRRDAATAEYLADHPGTTYDQLAERFGYCHRKDAYNAVLRAKADIARPAITKLIGDESVELDALYAEACAILQRRHITVSHGKVITWLNPETQQEETLLDDGPKLAAIQAALRIRESYRKLHGLDQPAQVAVSGSVKYEVVGVAEEDLT